MSDEIQKTNDNVNHPSHYTMGKIEVIDAIEDWGLDKNFLRANAIKYLARADHKGKKLEDLKKGMWYLAREIAHLEKGSQELNP